MSERATEEKLDRRLFSHWPEDGNWCEFEYYDCDEVDALLSKLIQERDQYKMIAELNRDTILAMQDAKEVWETIAHSRDRS
jgi:hypothetical protein